MKVGGGLNYVTGPMGAGKTLFGVRQITAALCAGQYVVTNVELMPDAFERIARHNAPVRARLQGSYRDRFGRGLASYYVFEEDLSRAIRYRVPGRGEGRAIVVWDEGHNDLNNRDWRQEGRAQILRWATQLRKLGFVGYLLSQHADNTDAALRRVCNFHVQLRNQREAHRVLGFRMTPWPLFLAYWFPAHLPGNARVEPVRVDRYLLSWHRKLYDTWGLYHGLDVDDELAPIMLPEGGRPITPVTAPTETETTHSPAGQSLFDAA